MIQCLKIHPKNTDNVSLNVFDLCSYFKFSQITKLIILVLDFWEFMEIFTVKELLFNFLVIDKEKPKTTQRHQHLWPKYNLIIDVRSLRMKLIGLQATSVCKTNSIH